MTFPVLSAGTSAYNLQRSLRLRASASAYLSRTPASASNRTTLTFSGWVKRGILSTAQSIMSAWDGTSASGAQILFTSGNSIQVILGGSATQGDATTNAVYRDPSAWYHIVAVIDTTQASSANRIQVYVNNVQQTLTVANTPALNATSLFNSTSPHSVGAFTSIANYFDGYMDEINFIDGQALTPSSFGSTNAVTGVWQPAKYTGTYGTNGFYLPFTNTTSTTTLGNDFSGNGNNWTTNNISLTPGATYDAMTDVPTLTSATAANYCVLNPLNVVGATISGGNLNTSTGLTQGFTVGTIGIPTTGKYYFEVTNGSTTAPAQVSIGLQVQASPPTSFSAAGGYTLYLGYAGATANLYINNNGTNSSANVVSTTASDVLNLAYDASTGKLWLGYNNVWKNSSGATDGAANPATGANPTITISAGLSLFPFHHVYSNTASINFGQRPFAYTPPSGFVALNTFNLPSSTIPAGNKFMDATLYTGTGSSLSVTNSGAMQPDWVWIKSRSAATDHALYDVLRGTQSRLESNTTDAQVTSDNGVTAFGTGGFTVNTLAQVNTSAATYVGWQWKANGAGVTNTAGSITSTVSANTTSGFSVVTYTANGTNGATVGHGLNVTPAIYIVKRRDTTGNWVVVPGNSSLFGGSFYLQLNTTSAVISNSDVFTSYPGSSVFYLSTNADVNASGGTYVAYCIAQIAGFSAVGKYTGNGSADGPFVYTGFRPRWLMIKRTDSTANWRILDTSRDTSNVEQKELYPSLANAEGTFAALDGVSNGFKIRTDDSSYNASGGTYIYAAFAENPFKNALAR